MDNGALPVPQGLMALLGGLSPARQGAGEAAGNGGFRELLAQLLAGGELTLEGVDAADVPQALLPLLAAGDGNTLPLPDGAGADGGDATADLEALLALLGVPSAPPVPAGAGQVPTPPVAAGDGAEISAAALLGQGNGSGTAGGPDKSAIQFLQSLQSLQSMATPPPAGAVSAAGLEVLAAAESLNAQNPGAGRPPEQGLPPPLRAVDALPPGTPGSAIQTPVSRPEWGQELGQRVLWMTAGNGSQQAELKLNPPQLGPLEVRVVVRNEEVSVFFNANHALTREALEQAMPRLREMLGANGIQLAEANVGGGRDDGGEGAAFGHEGDGSGGRGANGALPEGAENEPGRPSGLVTGSPRGLVDTYV